MQTSLTIYVPLERPCLLSIEIDETPLGGGPGFIKAFITGEIEDEAEVSWTFEQFFELIREKGSKWNALSS